jgi:hypothetical protein
MILLMKRSKKDAYIVVENYIKQIIHVALEDYLQKALSIINSDAVRVAGRVVSAIPISQFVSSDDVGTCLACLS